MASAIALIVAGSGEVVPEEIEDLLNDAYPEEDYEEIGLIVPVDKDLYTKTVQDVVAWYGKDEDVYAISVEGGRLARSREVKAFGGDEDPLEVKAFENVLDPEEHKEWDEVHFLLALPEPDDEDYDLYADLAEVALSKGLVVKNLAKALDDVTLSEPDAPEPEPDPEPEPEKPARKTRARRKSEPVEDEKVAEQVPEGPADVHDEVAQAVREINSLPKVGLDDRDVLVSFLLDVKEAAEKALSSLLPGDEAPETPEPTEKAAEAPKRGRGRPRTDFDVRQVWDEDKEDWEPRPAGRLRKGTRWRTVHSESGEVLDEGTS